MSNTYTSKPYLMIAQGVLNQIDTISSSDDYPLHFYGLTLNNDLIDLGVLTNRKLKVKRSLKISADECKVQNENIAKIDAMRK